MTEPDDPVLAEINGVIALAHAGDAATARERFTEIWTRLGPAGDPIHRCVVAHHAADVQADLHEELRWDLRALAAADAVTDAHPSAAAVAGFYPSLHLNLADVYRRLGDRERAGRHIAEAQEAIGTLGDDGYGRMIRDGIARCAARLDAEDVLRSTM